MGDALFTHGGVLSAREGRLDLAGLLATQGASSLDTRTGVMFGPGSLQIVTGTGDTAPMTVAVAVNHWVTSRGVANGPYLGATESVVKVPIDAAPSSGSRMDVIYEIQQDAADDVPTKDAVTAPKCGVLKGPSSGAKPDLSTVVGAEEIATVTLTPGASATNGANVTIANTARQTVARGADIPVSSKAERDALTKFIGLAVKRLDAGGRVERYTGTGNIWASGSDVPVLASMADRDAYFTGNLRGGASALVAGTTHVYDGAAWKFMLTGNFTGSGDGSGFKAIPHGAGRAPNVWGISQATTGVSGVDAVLKLLKYNADVTNLVIQAWNEDSNAAMANNPVAGSWWGIW